MLHNASLRSFRVWQRDLDVYLTNWRTEFLPPLSEPVLYVFAFGFGLGSLIHNVHYQGRELSYLRFMAPGIVAVAIMFWSYFETTYSSFVRMYYQRTFDAILATPLLVEDVILGELLWGATKAVIASTIMLCMLALLGLVTWPSALWVIPLSGIAGVLFSALGLVVTSVTRNISSFNLPMFLMIMPMFMFSGTFFPVSILPKWALAIAWCLPLTHVSHLVRAAVLGWPRGPLLAASVLYVVLLAAVLSALALKLMKRRLIQ
ncbi:MAG: ABC transporter permease [Candidatus Eisenbacteria bacterium]|uniref:Transport permease protein n=1 Tax=Eiseniibacteriota bacterium TaxID=2212470 RepID=A0A538T6F7_UNCEI|nr:MAG: ABC transporter permease [Candidatus Eisenbacteria bacterium]